MLSVGWLLGVPAVRYRCLTPSQPVRLSQGDCRCCLLVAKRPSSMPVHLKNKSSLSIVRAATLR